MDKQFKLVYEKDGIVKGNYEGVPAAKDTPLIERAVLEGNKPAPEPAPEPTGTIEITKNGNYDVKAFANAKVNIPSPEPEVDTSLLPDFFVPFMDVSEEGADGTEATYKFIHLIGEDGYEQGYDILNEFLTNLKFKAKFPLSEETRDQLEDVIIYHVEATSDDSAEISYYPIKDVAKKYHTSIVVETNAETGNSRYIFGEVVKEEE